MKQRGREVVLSGVARRGAMFVVAALLAVGTLAPASQAQGRGSVNIPQGTSIDIRVDTPVDSNVVRPGDEFRAVVASSVVVDGIEVIPSGTIVSGSVTDIVSNKSFGRSSGVVIRLGQLASPNGGTVSVNGNLGDANGGDVLTVDNVPRGARLRLVVQRSFYVDERFFGRPGGPGGPGGPGDDVFTSPETITQVQSALRDLGYYTGRIDGRLTPPTRLAIQSFQRDQRISQTGFLDRDTLDRLGLISQSGSEVSLVNVISANATIQNGNALQIRVATSGTNGMSLFEDHLRQRDAIHVYVRGFRGNPGPRPPSDLLVTLSPEEWRGVDRIVIHGTGNDIVIRANEVGANVPLTPQEAAVLEGRVTRLLQQYAAALNVRYNALTGQIVFSPSTNYRENETELLFALNSAASTARLYTQLLRTSTDAQAIQGATDVFVSQANAVERAISRTKSGRASSTIAGWQALRGDFQRLDEASSNDFQGTPAYR